MRLRHSGPTIVFEGSEELICDFDATRIEQAFRNYVENAALHGDPESVVAVSLFSVDAQAFLTIHNDGLPIDARDILDIFSIR
jgi:signal transduction histidine kinase